MKINLFELFFLVLNIGLIVIYGLLFETTSVIIPLMCMLLLVAIVYLFQGKLLKQYLIGFLFLNCMVCFFYFANISAYGEPFYQGGSDDNNFEEAAFESVQQGIFLPTAIADNILEQFSVGSGYVSFLGVLMYFSDILGVYHTILPRLMNTNFLIGVVIVLNFFIAKKQYFNLTYQKIFTLLLLCTPNIAFINSYIFRDVLNLFQVMLLVLAFYVLIKCKSILGRILVFIIMIVLIYFMYHTRLQSILFSIILVLPLLTSKIEHYKGRIIVVGCILLFVAYKFLQLDYYIDNYTKYLISLASGLSTVIFNIELFPFGIIARFIYGLIIPFPNFFNLFKENEMYLLDLGNTLIYIGVVIQIIFLPFILKQLLKFNWVTISFISMYLIVIITTFTFRHFIFYYPFLLLLILKGWNTSNKRTLILSSSVIYLSLFAMMYIVLKI